MITEWVLRKKPSVLGLVSGAISGLVVITPACGYVDQTGAFFMGVIAGPCCYFAIKIKEKMGFDDALDAFGVHGVGGMVGGILTGFFANKNISKKEKVNGLFYGRPEQVYIQLYGIVVIASYSFVMTIILIKSLDAVLKAVSGIGMRVSEV
jgi:Amt family ammonium transporter